MLHRLLARIVAWCSGPHGREGGGVRKPSSFQVESLEERTLFSANTTIPTVTGIAPVTWVSDVGLNTLPRVNADIIFLGDSITWGYEYGAGQPIWSAVTSNVSAADLAAIGQTTQSLLYQLSLGQLVGFNPSVVVLTIGTNNLREGDTPQATAEGIVVDVATIHHYAPTAQVLLLGVPPGSADPNDPYRQQVAQTDALVQQLLAGDSHSTYLNIAPAFEQGDGAISTLSMFDYLHPTLLGYANMTATLYPDLVRSYAAGTSRQLAI
jgi:lysophospholipase L1-like esterase